MRREQRRNARVSYSISWQDESGVTRSAQVMGLDMSDTGIGLECSVELPQGTVAFIQGASGQPRGYGAVRHCTRRDEGYLIGLELSAEARKTLTPSSTVVADYYELLQISPKAEAATIQRVHRFLAARYHPDNPATGDPEKFLLLQNAYETLADPMRRAEYDATRQPEESRPAPMSDSVDFMDGVQGEVNRRLALLSLLYNKRRSDPEDPEVSLAEVETRMGFPRDYLHFTIWYLKNKKYLTRGDNADLALTALGVDFVEANCVRIPMLNKLLSCGTEASPGFGFSADREDPDLAEQALLSTPGEDTAVGLPE